MSTLRIIVLKSLPVCKQGIKMALALLQTCKAQNLYVRLAVGLTLSMSQNAGPAMAIMAPQDHVHEHTASDHNHEGRHRTLD